MRALMVAIVAGVLVACAAEDPAGTSPPASAVASTTTVAQDTSSTGESDSAGPATITIESFSFGSPLEVPAGSVVTVVNRDSAVHTWTSSDDLFDSGNLSTGQEFTHVFDSPGEFGFFCVIHPGMTGTVTVSG